MTKFRKTIFGKILGGAGKIAAVAAGGVVAGKVLGLGKPGQFKLKNIFKKKQPGAGTVAGNYISDAVKDATNAAMASAGASVGSATQQLASEFNAMTGGGNEFTQGFKSGFLGKFFSENKNIIFIVGLAVIGLVIWLVAKKKRGRR